MSKFVCVNGDGFAKLTKGESYRLIEDAASERLGMVRVIDDSGASRAYPESRFRLECSPTWQSADKAVAECQQKQIGRRLTKTWQSLGDEIARDRMIASMQMFCRHVQYKESWLFKVQGGVFGEDHIPERIVDSDFFLITLCDQGRTGRIVFAIEVAVTDDFDKLAAHVKSLVNQVAQKENKQNDDACSGMTFSGQPLDSKTSRNRWAILLRQCEANTKEG